MNKWIEQRLYTCVFYLCTRFQETNSDQLGKRKIWHTTSVAIFWDNFNQILRPSLPEKLNGERCDEMNIKIVVIYPYAELQSIWRIPDCGTKFGPSDIIRMCWKWKEVGIYSGKLTLISLLIISLAQYGEQIFLKCLAICFSQPLPLSPIFQPWAP